MIQKGSPKWSKKQSNKWSKNDARNDHIVGQKRLQKLAQNDQKNDPKNDTFVGSKKVAQKRDFGLKNVDVLRPVASKNMFFYQRIWYLIKNGPRPNKNHKHI